MALFWFFWARRWSVPVLHAQSFFFRVKMMNLWLIPSSHIKKKLIYLFSHRTLLQSRWHNSITRLHVNMHCFRTGVEKGMKLCTAVQDGCGYKDTLHAHHYFAPLAKYFTVCITYQLPLVYSESGHVWDISGPSAKINLGALHMHTPELTLQIWKCKNLHTKYILTWHMKYGQLCVDPMQLHGMWLH